jgi:hypothetical protein
MEDTTRSMETVSEVLKAIDAMKRTKDTPSKWQTDELNEIILRLNSADYTGIDRVTLDRVEIAAKFLRGIYAAKAARYEVVPRWDVMVRLGSKRGPMVEKQEHFL